jgi:predicted RNA-binding protein Jag
MAHATSVQATVATIGLLAKTAVDTRVVQSVQVMVATIVRLALEIVTHVLHTETAMTVRLAPMTAADTRVVQSVLHTVVQVQLPVVATVVK